LHNQFQVRALSIHSLQTKRQSGASNPH
jgi:hypothetical protein